MRRPSERTAGATFLDREARIAAIRAAAERLRSRRPEVRRVVLFGSLAHGLAGPRSDADLLIEVASSAHAELRNRIPEMLEGLQPLPCPVDLFILTSEELQRREASIGVVRVALEHGIDMLGT
jgi:predicted nucleotidyltransferase